MKFKKISIILTALVLIAGSGLGYIYGQNNKETAFSNSKSNLTKETSKVSANDKTIDAKSSKPDSTNKISKESVSVDWTKSYTDYSEAIKDADLIVIAHVDSQKPIVDKDPFEMVNTISIVTIKNIIKNSNGNQAVNNTINVFQVGGVLDGVDRIPDEVALLEPGKDYLLILTAGAPDNSYTPIGGWQGNVPIESGKLTKNSNRTQVNDAIENALINKTSAQVQSDIKTNLAK